MLAGIFKDIVNVSKKFHHSVHRIVFAAIYFGQLKRTKADIFTKPISDTYEPGRLTILFVGDNMPLLASDEFNVIHIEPLTVGMSLEDYKDKIKATIVDLQNKNLPNEKIVLIGKALDAAICLEIASEYKGINVIADGVFSRLDDTAGLTIKNMLPTWILRLTLGNLLYYTIRGLVNQLGLGVDAGAAYVNIIKESPEAAKILRRYDDPQWHDYSDTLIAYKDHQKIAAEIQQHLRSFSETTPKSHTNLKHHP
jgi:hypothetical protein